MPLTERTEIGQRNVLSDGQIQVRVDTVVERDGVEIARTYDRHVVAPGDDLTREHTSVKRLAKVEHTRPAIAAYKAARAEAELALLEQRPQT